MKTGSITKAADFLCIAQPSVSRLIGDLEASIGFLLFARAGGRLIPTAEAVRFHAAVEQSFIGMDRLSRAAETIRSAATDQLVVAASPMISQAVMPGAIKAFVVANPGISVLLYTHHVDDIVELVVAHKVELGMSLLFTKAPGVRQIPVAHVRFICALPPGHPLASKQVIEISDFHEQDYVGLSDHPLVDWEGVEGFFAAHGVVPHTRVRTPYLNTAYALVAAGLGMCLLDPLGAELWQHMGVEIRPIAEDFFFTYSILLPTDAPISAATRKFVDCIQAHLATHPPLLNDANNILKGAV